MSYNCHKIIPFTMSVQLIRCLLQTQQSVSEERRWRWMKINSRWHLTKGGRKRGPFFSSFWIDRLAKWHPHHPRGARSDNWIGSPHADEAADLVTLQQSQWSRHQTHTHNMQWGEQALTRAGKDREDLLPSLLFLGVYQDARRRGKKSTTSTKP